MSALSARGKSAFGAVQKVAASRFNISRLQGITPITLLEGKISENTLWYICSGPELATFAFQTMFFSTRYFNTIYLGKGSTDSYQDQVTFLNNPTKKRFFAPLSPAVGQQSAEKISNQAIPEDSLSEGTYRKRESRKEEGSWKWTPLTQN